MHKKNPTDIAVDRTSKATITYSPAFAQYQHGHRRDKALLLCSAKTGKRRGGAR